MERKAPDGEKSQRKLHIIKSIKRLLLVYLIYLNKIKSSQ
nr:MAG TPA: hypothetical protein [Caudoviricetes sp.]